jgi:hypothetical protein
LFPGYPEKACPGLDRGLDRGLDLDLIRGAGLSAKNAINERRERGSASAPRYRHVPRRSECAFAAARAKNTYLQAQFLRLKARRGPKKAAIAVAASILTAVYHMLRDGTFYADLGPEHFARYDKTRAAMRLVRRIKDLGYDVEIKAAA